MNIEWISLILSLSAIVLSFINYRHRVKPSIRIVSVTKGFHEDIIVIEMERLKHGYHFYSVKTACMEKCTIIDYGQGIYSPRIPVNLLPKKKENLGYWINPKSSSDDESCLFWFTVSKTNRDRWLRLKFKSVSFPYKSSCSIPIIEEEVLIV
ncbi:hypothetical protein [Neisseria dumasiana]|uniref:Uncharacterized protein n=1 Tax=Neisseria dumasiana TaxID=1931275 RepID=A0ABX3WHP2_9NEIS|nr:hypothetical protein [Neisseria dumasiana]OSI21689.1 hypothetical protein BV913_12525 [Neisseria dumasiana]OSI27607.1 hypothetical protein BV913_11960 [Neisseria dumasiana]UOO83884.1 hypothetical protein LVJ88_09305 [Neisseria dumasiana]